jgi:hypothetical protein
MGLKDKHNLRIYEKQRIFGCRGENVTGGWRNLHGEEIHQ